MSYGVLGWPDLWQTDSVGASGENSILLGFRNNPNHGCVVVAHAFNLNLSGSRGEWLSEFETIVK